MASFPFFLVHLLGTVSTGGRKVLVVLEELDQQSKDGSWSSGVTLRVMGRASQFSARLIDKNFKIGDTQSQFESSKLEGYHRPHMESVLVTTLPSCPRPKVG